MSLTYRIMYPPMSPELASRIGGGDIQRAWTPLGGILVRGYGHPDFPVRLTGIERNGLLSQAHLMLPLRAGVLEEMGKALLQLAEFARERDEHDAVMRRALDY